MQPSSIAQKESQFASTLKLASGTVFKDCGTTNIPDGFTIRSIRPNDQSYYYQAVTPKKSICLHFTVGYIMSDIAALSKAGDHVSVSYVVDRGGRIYELFPDKFWSYHLGSSALGGNSVMSKQSIGIEISNYGPLTLKDGKLIDAYGNAYCSQAETEFYEACDYRGHKYYATMSQVQIKAVAALVKYLSAKHSIPLNFVTNDEPFKSANDAVNFSGVFFHSNVRKDKFDWPLSKSMSCVLDICKGTNAAASVAAAPKQQSALDAAKAEAKTVKMETVPVKEPEPAKAEPTKPEPVQVKQEPAKATPVQAAPAQTQSTAKAAASSTTSSSSKSGGMFSNILKSIKKLFHLG